MGIPLKECSHDLFLCEFDKIFNSQNSHLVGRGFISRREEIQTIRSGGSKPHRRELKQKRGNEEQEKKNEKAKEMRENRKFV